MKELTVTTSDPFLITQIEYLLRTNPEREYVMVFHTKNKPGKPQTLNEENNDYYVDTKF
jgi:hypothetical protein